MKNGLDIHDVQGGKPCHNASWLQENEMGNCVACVVEAFRINGLRLSWIQLPELVHWKLRGCPSRKLVRLLLKEGDGF